MISSLCGWAGCATLAVVAVLAVAAPEASARSLQADTPAADGTLLAADVSPDGRSMLVLDGIERARMRCGDDREALSRFAESAHSRPKIAASS